MPKKCEVEVGGRRWEIIPLRGLKSIKLMPKVISIGSELLWAANNAGFPLAELFTEEQDLTASFGDVIKAVKFVSDTLGTRFDEIRIEIIPFLLQQETQWLQDNGTPREIFLSLWKAIKFHAETSFGEEVVEALKKSLAAEEGESEAED